MGQMKLIEQQYTSVDQQGPVNSSVCCNIPAALEDSRDPVIPRIAVLLASFNGAHFLRSQVGSILEQQGVNVTIFIRDDGSTDATHDIALALAEQDSRVLCLSQNDQPRSFGSNFLNLILNCPAGFDAYAFADQDDLWFPSKLANAYQSLKQGYDFYSSGSVAFWENGKSSRIKPQQTMRKHDFLFQAGGAGCTIVMTGDVFAKVVTDLQDKRDLALQNFVHDWYFYAYARINNYRWYISEKPGLLYRQHSDNYSGANSGKHAVSSRIERLRNGWYRKMLLSVMELTDYKQHGDARIYKALQRLNWRDRLWLASGCLNYRRSIGGAILLAVFLLTLIR